MEEIESEAIIIIIGSEAILKVMGFELNSWHTFISSLKSWLIRKDHDAGKD